MTTVPNPFQINTKKKKFKESITGKTKEQLSNIILDSDSLPEAIEYIAESLVSGYYDTIWLTYFRYWIEYNNHYETLFYLLDSYREMNHIRYGLCIGDLRNNQGIRNRLAQLTSILFIQRTTCTISEQYVVPYLHPSQNRLESLMLQYFEITPSEEMFRAFRNIFREEGVHSHQQSIRILIENKNEDLIRSNPETFPGRKNINLHPVWILWTFIFKMNQFKNDIILNHLHKLFLYLLPLQKYDTATKLILRCFQYLELKDPPVFQPIPILHSDVLDQVIQVNMYYQRFREEDTEVIFDTDDELLAHKKKETREHLSMYLDPDTAISIS